MPHRHLIVFPIPEPALTRVIEVMDKLAERTGLEAPYKRLIPHITLHSPLTDLDEDAIKEAVTQATESFKRVEVYTLPLSAFGTHHIVLPISVPLPLKTFVENLSAALATIPGYTPSPYERENILHVTVAERVDEVFEQVWPKLEKENFPPLGIPLEKVELYRKPAGTGSWEKVAEFPLLKISV